MSKTVYESLIEKFLELKPDMTRDEIEDRIKKIKDKIGAGYLTDQGALYLIASDNGISLSNKHKESKTERKPEQKINSYDLKRKFDSLKSDYDRREKFTTISSILAMSALFSAVIFYSELPLEFKASLIILGSLMLIFALSTTVMIIQSRSLRLEKKDRIFMKFFQVYDDLQKLHDAPNKKNSKNAQNSIIILSRFIGLWTSNRNAPNSISGIPEELIKNLKKKIIPFVKIQSMSEIKKSKILFLEFSASISNTEPELNDLNSLNYSLDSFQKITEKELKVEGILTKKPMLKPIFIGIVFWVIFFTTLIGLEVEVGMAVAFSVTSAIALIAFVRREIGKNQED